MSAHPLVAALENALSARRYLLERGVTPPGELEEVLAHFRSQEWSGVRYGPGDGPMGSGGVPCPCCPVCMGLRHPQPGFTEGTHGHQPGCALAALLGDEGGPTAADPEELTL